MRYLFASLFACLYGSVLQASQPLKCEIAAPMAILINRDTGQVLFEKQADKLWYPASTTKVATALYVLHKIGDQLDQKIVASRHAVSIVPPAIRRNSGMYSSYQLEYGGTHMGIKVEEELDVRTLLYGLMLCSGNDAANVLAEYTCGAIPIFLDKMGEFLTSLGCKHTCFKNPHGLPDDTHITTVREMALIGAEAMKNPVFREIVASSKFERKETNKQPAGWLAQRNGLIRKGGKYFYPHAVGIKTGYIIKSGFNLVAAADKGDRHLVAVVFGCDESAKMYRSVIQLFETAFQETKESRLLLSKMHDLLHKQVEGAQNILDVALEEDLVVSYYPSEEQQYLLDIQWQPLALPIAEGECVGYARLIGIDKQEITRVPLRALTQVRPTFSYIFNNKKAAVIIWLRSCRIYIGYIIASVLLTAAAIFFRKKSHKKIV